MEKSSVEKLVATCLQAITLLINEVTDNWVLPFLTFKLTGSSCVHPHESGILSKVNIGGS